MSFLTSLQQFVSSGVASLSLTQRRFSLSRESSSEADAAGAAPGPAHAHAHAQGLVAQGSLPAPGSPRRDSGSPSPHHGFPKVVPTAGTMLGRRRTLDGPPPQGLMLPTSPRRTSSFRHQHNQLQQQHQQHQQHQQEQQQQRMLAMQQVQALRNHVFCRRRPSWPEVDPRATSGCLRMTPEMFQWLADTIRPLVQKQDSHLRRSISVEQRLSITLRHLATGETQESLHFHFRVGQSTISGIIREVCQALHSVLKETYLRFPTSHEEWRNIASECGSRWNFYNCIGAMDGKHVLIEPPINSGSTYYNYKETFSIVLLAIVDAGLRFIYVDVGTNGRVGDKGVWNKCSMKKYLEENSMSIPPPCPLPGTDKNFPFVIVGDEGFALTNQVMIPFSKEHLRGENSKVRRIFNYRVQETDGSFFESYTALSWKQENRRLLVARELQERPGPGHPGDSRGGDAQPHPHLERGIGPPLQPGVWWPPDQRTHGKEHEDLYVEVLYTLANRVGALPGSLPHGAHQGAHQGTSQDDLHDYAMAAFGFNSEQHRRLLAVAREEKPPIVVLNVVVLEAEGLEAKDANGLSDPYCLLGIQPSNNNNNNINNNSSNNNAGAEKMEKGGGDRKPLRLNTTALMVGCLAGAGAGPPLGPPTLGPPGSGPPGSPLIASPVGLVAGTIGFSDPYCMLGIQPGVQAGAGAGPGAGPGAGHSLSTPASPQQSTESDDGPAHHEKLRKHHSFRLSFKRREGREQRPHRDQRDSMSSAVPAKFIRATSVRQATLNPRWNEKFRFDIDDVSSDILHLDIWDHDDESSVLDAVSRLNEVRGVKGLGRFFKQIAQSARSGSADDFLGCINIPVADIPSQGVESWFNLEARTHRSTVQGRIHLKLWLSTREDRGTSEEDNWRDVRQQERLHEVFIAHALRDRELGGRTWEWRGELGAGAQAVLHQHAIQGDITDLQLALVRFVAFVRTAVHTPIDFGIVLKLMHDLEEQWDSGPLSQEEEGALAEAFNLWTEHGLLLVRRHRQLYPPRCKELCVRLERLLRTLAALGHMRAMAKCCPFNKDLRAELGCALRKAAADWYEELMRPVREAPDLDAQLHALVMMANRLLVGLQSARTAYEPVFHSVTHVPYFAITYKQIEKLVHADLCGITCSLLDEMRCAELGDDPGPVQLCTGVFELFLALQDVSALAEHAERAERAERGGIHSSLSLSDRPPTTLTTFYTWFEAALHRWLDLAHLKMSNRIQHSIEMNKLCTAELIVRHTTSAMDVSACFYHINEFWKLLNWPDLVSSYNIVNKIIRTISSAALFYADLTHQKLKDQGFYEDKGPYRTTDDMCAAINDLEYVRRALNHVPRDLGVDSILEAVEAAELAAVGEPGVGNPGVSPGGPGSEAQAMQAREAAREAARETARQNSGAWKEQMYAALEQAATQMEQYTLLIIAQIGAKMRPSLKKAMFHLAWSPDSLPTADSISPLLQYLDCHLQSLNAALLPKNFERALSEVWEVVLLELGHQMDGSSGDKLPGFYDRLHEALGILLAFFHADSLGLHLEALRTPTYFRVDQRLQYHRTDTERLMDLYHQQRLGAQLGCDSAEYGVLSVRAYFNHDSLCVEVLSARDVIPLDPNGFSDPFVIVELIPRRMFPHCAEQTTHVHKKTLNPVFDECFEFSVTLEQCRSEGAMILFTVMDHDVLTANDFAGEAFLALSSVPGVADTNSSIDNFHGLKQAELPLMHQKNRNHPILEVLETRLNDRTALDFVKKQRQRLATT